MIDNLQLTPGYSDNASGSLNDPSLTDIVSTIEGTPVSFAVPGADNASFSVTSGDTWKNAWSSANQNANFALKDNYNATVNSQTKDNHNYTLNSPCTDGSGLQCVGDKQWINGNKVGVLYTWKAATAGTGNGSSTSGGAEADPFGTNMNTQGNNTRVSICPAGWRLPTGGDGNGTTTYVAPGETPTNGDFKQLDIAYGGTGTNRTDKTDPAWLRLGGGTGTNLNNYSYQMIWSGRIAADGYQELNALDFSWSTTVYSYQLSYYLYVNTSGGMNPQNNGYKLYGFPVRCLAR